LILKIVPDANDKQNLQRHAHNMVRLKQETDVSMSPTFMVDHMLVRLGKYLRILGYDATWNVSTSSGLALGTHELIRRANAEGRVFLSRNKRLMFQGPSPDRAILVVNVNPVRQLEEIVDRFGLDQQERLFSRYIRCNVDIESVADKRAIRDRVHPNVFARYRRFYICPSCGSVFWKGSHVRNTCAKLGLEAPKSEEEQA
jgi:uncharacterized protein